MRSLVGHHRGRAIQKTAEIHIVAADFEKITGPHWACRWALFGCRYFDDFFSSSDWDFDAGWLSKRPAASPHRVKIVHA